MIDREEAIAAIKNMMLNGEPQYIWSEDAVKAIEDLKGKEARVMTLEEVKHAEIVYLEFQDIITARIVDSWFGSGDGDIRLPGIDGVRYMPKAEYGDLWRCWTSRPTDEQREAAKWK